MGPIDYNSMLTRLDVSPLLQGMQVDEQRRYRRAQTAIAQQELEAARQKALADQDENRSYQEAVAEVLSDPTADKFGALALRFPKQREAIEASLGSYTDGQKSRNLDAAVSLAGLLNVGDNEGALTMLKRRKGAVSGGGETTEITDRLISMLESGNPEQIKQAKGLAGFVIASQMGDKAAPVMERLGFGGDGEQLKGYGPGSWVFDDTGNVVAKIPFAPGTGDFTLGEGQRRFSNGGGASPYEGADPLGAVKSAIPGITVTSGRRTVDGNKAVGGVPNSAHLNGGAFDVTPGSSKRSMGALAYAIRKQLPGAKVLNEGDHVHVEVPGWKGAPSMGGVGSGGASEVASVPKTNKPDGAPKPRNGTLKPGVQMNGYTFLGGDPKSPTSWRRAG